MLKLFHHPVSVSSAKVRLVLEEKKIPWEGKVVDLYRGEQFEPWYLSLNPAAVVPTLAVDDRVVRESVAICEYLEEAFPQTSLVPNDLAARARMRVWCKDVETFMSVAASGVSFPMIGRYEVEKLNSTEIERYYAAHPHVKLAERKREWVVQGFASKSAQQAVLTYNKFLYKLDLQLAKSKWLVDDEYSLADAAATPYVALLELFGFQEWTSRMKHVANWFARVSGRSNFEPAVVQAISPEFRQAMRHRGEAAWPEIDAVLATAEPFNGRSPWAMRADAI